MAKITFLGAAGCVTGSKYLVEAAGKRLLLDCGIFQGSPELNDRNYSPLSVDPKTIDYSVLTHAHLDHTGWLPCLVKAGFKGPIFANPATIDLTTILLKDSAHIQEEDALHAQKHGYSRHANPQPLYVGADVDPVLRLLKPAPRTGAFTVSPEFQFVAYDAGHILGSTSLVLTINEGNKKTVVIFSGDVGRYNQVILKDPVTPPVQADVLLCESTYGDREHQPGDPAAEIAAVVNRVSQRGGCIVIPAFAIGRTQTFMYYLRQLEDANKIPRLPAVSYTHLDVYKRQDKEPEHNRFIRSDQYSFIKKGVPALAFKFGYLPGAPEEKIFKAWYTDRYHAPSDDANQPVDLAAAAQFNAILEKLALRVANADQRPTWKPDSFFRRFLQ